MKNPQRLTCIDKVKGLLANPSDLLVLQGKHPRVERDPHSEPRVLGKREARRGTAEGVAADGRTGTDLHISNFPMISQVPILKSLNSPFLSRNKYRVEQN